MKKWQFLGSLVQALLMGTLLAIAFARFLGSANGVAAFKYQGF